MPMAKHNPWAPYDHGRVNAGDLSGEFTSEPPELPGFNTAPVWITPSISRPDCECNERPRGADRAGPDGDL